MSDASIGFQKLNEKTRSKGEKYSAIFNFSDTTGYVQQHTKPTPPEPTQTCVLVLVCLPPEVYLQINSTAGSGDAEMRETCDLPLELCCLNSGVDR